MQEGRLCARFLVIKQESSVVEFRERSNALPEPLPHLFEGAREYFS